MKAFEITADSISNTFYSKSEERALEMYAKFCGWASYAAMIEKNPSAKITITEIKA